MGTNRKANDGSVFPLPSLKSAIDNSKLNLPDEYIILGDDAFPLSPNLMKPYAKINFATIRTYVHTTIVHRVHAE